ncbi:MAG TPA: histidine kinase [Chitinophagaceae bacterium]|nr:histidine kinase [Chitinophagaceae bacterium]
MKHFRNIIALLTFSFVFGLEAYSQFKFEKPVLITKENGLPINDIRSVKKGDDGFMWLATPKGICRFDGLQVKVFGEGEDLRYSLFDSWVESVQPVKHYIWAATHQGVSVLNTKDNTFRHYQLGDAGKLDSLKRQVDQTVNVLYKDKNENIWIGTRDRGVCVYDSAKDNFRFFPVPPNKYPPLIPSLASHNGILNIRESRTNDSIIWAGTPSGLVEINKYSGEVKLFTFPQKSKDYQVAVNAFRRLYHHDDGRLYVGSWAASVNVFDPVAKTFTPLEVKDQVAKKILTGVISNLTRKSDHEIWITSGLGLVIYDSRLKDVTWYKLNDPVNLEFYAVNFIDETNRVWYSDINGLSCFDPAVQQFTSHSFKHLSGINWGMAFYIIPDKTGNIITVCPRVADGFFRFNRLKNQWTKTTFPGNKTFLNESDVVRGFVQLASGDYIISSDKGIFLYSEKQNRISSLQKELPFAEPTRRGQLMLDRSGNLWITDDIQGLIKWRPGTNTYRFYKKELLWTDTSTRSVGRVEDLFEDSKGNIWFQRGTGMGVYLAAKDSILNFIYPDNPVNSMLLITSFAEDRNGKIWVSAGEGSFGYALVNDPYKGIVYKSNLRERGINSTFPYLATDKNGEVWGYTPDELVKINADNLSFTTYSFQYGATEPDFFHFAFLPTGEMIFGGRNDITIANPSELKRNTELPVPYIAEVKVLNQTYNLTPGGSPLRLKHKQNFFSIGFSAKAYTMAKDVKFRYRLNSFDEWTEVTGRRFANYTNVPGGNYVFQLQAANNEGVWNDKILEMPIFIATPIWLTWWFRILVILAVISLAYWLYRYRVQQVKKKQRLQTDYEKKLANVEMTALLAQMNPHFLFNSLNSIDSYIIRNESKKASEYLNNFARLMRLILQNSRSNYINLKDELEALELYMQMESLRFKNKFSYSIAVDENVETSSIVIPPMLIQPYVENAIWHGLMHKTNGTEGLVKINISKNADDLLCVIEDNGIGRKKAAELKGQKQNNHKRSMGMQITKDRIEIINKLYNMNASINIYDMEDMQGNAKGTKVELIIPV